MHSIIQTAADILSTPKPASGDLMTELPQYLTEMQSTIAALAAAIALVTVIAALVGIGFTWVGLSLQRSAKQEVKELRRQNQRDLERLEERRRAELKTAEEVYRSQAELLGERMVNSSQRNELKLLQDTMNVRHELSMVKMREEMVQNAERVGNLYLSEFKHKMLDVETAYGSNMKAVEDILMSFQEECVAADPAGPDRFDFPRYNTFRHLLTKLVVGTKPDVSGSLGRLFVEYASNIGEYPGRSLRAFVAGLMDADRIARADQRILAMRLIAELDRRFPPAEVDES